ncbi:MAG: hypothetical protein ABEK17_04115 [Candidatus Aenigmatarchaeota archaeon]
MLSTKTVSVDELAEVLKNEDLEKVEVPLDSEISFSERGRKIIGGQENLFANAAELVHGDQAGIFNRAGKIHGKQKGWVNYASNIEGDQESLFYSGADKIKGNQSGMICYAGSDSEDVEQHGLVCLSGESGKVLPKVRFGRYKSESGNNYQE